MKFMGINIKCPIIVNVENMGSLFMAVNRCRKQTKHIDTRFHFILDYVEKGFIKVIFVPTDLNKADVFTKNNNCEKFDQHT